MITLAIFAFFSALAVVSAVLIIVQKNAMYSVLYLAFTVLSVAGVFFTLEAEYLGAIQILVYGGGIVVLYIFVIIIVNLDEVVRERRRLFPKIFIFAVPALLLGEIASETERRLAAVTKRNEVLERKLHIANALIALQKKACAILDIALPESDEET